jgi:peptidoglycan/xylan/chitin deacetylase (PgdA/CDA1 family)
MFDLTLTFDNGPTAEATPAVLDVLRRHGVKGTFFAVGRQVEAPGGRELCERIVADGHWLGTHTYSHAAPFGALPADEAERELDGGDAAVAGLAHPDRLMRPLSDGGFLDRRVLTPAILERLQAGRYSLALWTNVPRDWEAGDAWIDRALAACEQRAWSVLILHDIPGGCADGLDRFLERARAAGARLRQELPDDCLPLHRGVLRADIDHLIAA